MTRAFLRSVKVRGGSRGGKESKEKLQTRVIDNEEGENGGSVGQ